jgi:DNA-binding response OmpR family regulator
MNQFNGKSILVIEDEEKVASFLRQGLEEEGFKVDLSGDGLTGFEKIMANNYDLLLLDLMLPGKSGEEICCGLREKGNTIPIIILTARDMVEDKVALFNCGADDYLVKPFEFEELLARIGALLRRPRDPSGTVMNYHDLTINLMNNKVTRNGESINLSAREFQLLAFMLKNRDTVVTKEQLITEVWQLDFDPHTNVVDVYMNYLRSKIDKPFPDKLLHTVRGKGYILQLRNQLS